MASNSADGRSRHPHRRHWVPFRNRPYCFNYTTARLNRLEFPAERRFYGKLDRHLPVFLEPSSHLPANMATFAELLTEYVVRSGISDTELARSVGVRRQTIFRWKEGIVGRPRHRDDVLRCAQRLHLSAHEQDALLLAAGFPPEGGPPPADFIHALQAGRRVLLRRWLWMCFGALLS